MRMFLLCLLMSLPFGLAAQPNTGSLCDGTVAMVRVSEVKAGGSLDGFMKAVAAHKAWYRAHGVQDNEIFAARVIVRDAQTKAYGFSPTQILTYHVNAPSGDKAPKHDDGYAAFVKMYSENSDIKSEYLTCMPKMALK